MTTELAPLGFIINQLPSSASAHDDADDAALKAVQPIADELDRVRRIVSELGLATLLAEIRETPTAVVCAALQDVAAAASRAVEELRDWGRLGH